MTIQLLCFLNHCNLLTMKFGNIKYNNFFIITVLVNILLIVLLLINNSQLSFMHRELMKYKNLLFEYTYVNHNINASSYMSIGQSKAEITVKSFVTGTTGHYDCAFGWYLATPLVSISMSYNGTVFNINIGVVIGSEAHDVGGAYVSPSQLN